MDLLSRLCREQSQTTVLVTHNARVATYADRVLVVADGRIVDDVEVGGGGADTDTAGFRALLQRLERHDL